MRSEPAQPDQPCLTYTECGFSQHPSDRDFSLRSKSRIFDSKVRVTKTTEVEGLPLARSQIDTQLQLPARLSISAAMFWRNSSWVSEWPQACFLVNRFYG